MRFNGAMANRGRRIDAELTDGDLVAGVLSGTSADGIDVVLAHARIEGVGAEARLVGLEQVAASTEPFEPSLAARVRAVLDSAVLDGAVLDGAALDSTSSDSTSSDRASRGAGPPTLAEIALLHRDLGCAFGSAARAVAERARVGPLALVASHGQTVFHHDGDPSLGKVTLQLGDGDAVAEAAGCAVASDFRTRDCAAGGEGAPLVALVDDVLFRGAPRPLAILNLGGIANWTILRADRPPLASDTGPAGALLDGLARRLLGAPFDLGGAAALAGTVDPEVVDDLMGHPYIRRAWPKTTGRDTFGENYVDDVVARLGGSLGGRSAPDICASAVRFIARAAARGLGEAGLAGQEVHVAWAGGGTHNEALLIALREEIDHELAALGATCASSGSSDLHGVSVDHREALAFAALGVRLALGEPSTVPETTGAAPGRVLGKWSPAAMGA